jgi:hypothetical protein
VTRTEVQTLQRRVGAEPDGFWGPKSQAACRLHLSRLMPTPNPWPAGSQAALREFYGQPGNESNLVVIRFPFPMVFGDKAVATTRVHKRCADSLVAVLESIERLYHNRPEIMQSARRFAGVYNFRNKRGGSTFSVHAWGAAIDLDPGSNSFRATWPLAAKMPIEIMEEFSKKGWTSAGAFWGYDAMHFEAVRPA